MNILYLLLRAAALWTRQAMFFCLICSICILNTGVTDAATVQLTQDAADARANDVYSPKLIYQTIQGKKTLVMYFGGWYQTDPTTLPNDSIYRAVCSAPNSCGLGQKVIDPVAMQMGSASMVNDPAIVELNNNGQDYLVMYMTAVTGDNRNDGSTVQNNKIYYSVSWATDGVHWSTPKLLLNNGWLPSATVDASGNVFLYSNTNWNNNTVFLSRCSLGRSGVEVGACAAVVTNAEKSYINVDVTYQKQLNLFQMLAQDATGAFNSAIDYLDSQDGLVWELRAQNVVAAGMTPAVHPDSACWLYYGKASLTYQSNIYLTVWC